MNLFAHLVFALVVVALAGRLVGHLFRRVGQPPVVGQVVAGILLGPTLLGTVWPTGFQFLVPPDIVPWLGIVAEVGVVVYMFLVGLELDTSSLRSEIRATVGIACGSLAVPFVLGLALATQLPSTLVPTTAPPVHFASFFGIAMTIVAFPVLARILADRGLDQTPVGCRALAIAAISDVVIWCALAAVVGATQAVPGEGFLTSASAAVFVAGAFFIGRPLVRRAVGKVGGTPGLGASIVALAVLAATAWLGHTLGVHRFIAAFILGALVPHDSPLARTLTARLSGIVAAVFLPAFFAFIGLETQIGLVAGVAGWLLTGLIIVIASAGKIGGTFVAARLAGVPTRDATTLGILMNTRGLMELVVLDIGLRLGLIAPELFAMMVVMALVTTMMTAPLLNWSTSRADRRGVGAS